MATDNVAQDPGASNSGRMGSLFDRARLARTVVVGSFLTIFLLTAVLIALAKNPNAAPSQAAEKAFNAILPVLAGWVGTVLAFYFSSAAQEHTNAILDKTIARVGGSPGSDVLVSEKMIPLSKIVGLRDLNKIGPDKAKIGPDKITVGDLQDDFNKKLPNGASVSRLLFVEDGVFKYILHVGTFNGFIVKNRATGEGAPLTFADMLKDQDMVNQISKLVVFVSAATTLSDAKNALDKVAGAQDIIVTPTGNATEPMLGWLSNVDLTKALTVS